MLLNNVGNAVSVSKALLRFRQAHANAVTEAEKGRQRPGTVPAYASLPINLKFHKES